MGAVQPKRSKRSPWRQRAWVTMASVSLLVVGGCQATTDRLHILLNPPSPEVERLAQATTMTPLAQRIFYRQNPTIEPRDVFLEQCDASIPEDTVILGCYFETMRGNHRAGGKIVIKAIDDPQFKGTMEVTAAHEMLHAAYDLLDEAEKEKLFEQLKVAQGQVTDKRLLQILANYETGEVARYQHELYAHLGTELKAFNNPALEAHYQRYFRDRQRVIALVEKSAQVITTFDQQAKALETEIEWLEAKLKKSQQVLEANAARLNQISRKLALQKKELLGTRIAAEAAIETNDFRADQLVDQFKRGQLAFNLEVEDYNNEFKQHQKSLERFDQRLEAYRQEVDLYNQMAQDTRKALEGLEGTMLVSEDISLP